MHRKASQDNRFYIDDLVLFWSPEPKYAYVINSTGGVALLERWQNREGTLIREKMGAFTSEEEAEQVAKEDWLYGSSGSERATPPERQPGRQPERQPGRTR